MSKAASMNIPIAILALAVGWSAACAAASAAPVPASAPAVEAVIACRAAKEDAARLACYDKAVAAMDAAQSQGDLVTLDREQRRAVRRQAFGFTLPAFNIFDRGEKPEEASRITAKVASASQDLRGKWQIKLDDGAVWLQTDDEDLLRLPKAGMGVVVRRGALGSFFLKVEGDQAFRARRVS